MFRKYKFLYRMYRAFSRDEKLELKFIKSFLKPGMIAFDIGVYKGVYSYWFTKLIKNEGLVIGFEPQFKYYQYVLNIMESLKFNNYTIKNIALSDTNENKFLNIPISEGKNDSWASLEKISDSNYEKEEVICSTLDDFCKKEKLLPDLIKCDVEGHEFSVFQGAKNILKSSRTIFLFECEEHHLNSDISMYKIFIFIKEFNYVGFCFQKNKGLKLLNLSDELSMKEDLKTSTRNFVFMPVEMSKLYY